MSEPQDTLNKLKEAGRLADQIGEAILDQIAVAAYLIQDPRVDPWIKGLMGVGVTGALYLINKSVPEKGIIPDGVFVFRGVDFGKADNGVVSKSLATAVLGAVSIWALQKVADPEAVKDAWAKRRARNEASPARASPNPGEEEPEQKRANPDLGAGFVQGEYRTGGGS